MLTLTPRALRWLGRIAADLRRTPLRQSDADLADLVLRTGIRCQGRPCTTCGFSLLMAMFGAGLVHARQGWQLGLDPAADFLVIQRSATRCVLAGLRLLPPQRFDEGVLEPTAAGRIATLVALPPRVVQPAVDVLVRAGRVRVAGGTA